MLKMDGNKDGVTTVSKQLRCGGFHRVRWFGQMDTFVGLVMGRDVVKLSFSCGMADWHLLRIGGSGTECESWPPNFGQGAQAPR